MLSIKLPLCLSGEKTVFFPITTGFLFVLWWAGVAPLGCGKGQALIPFKTAWLVTDQRGIPRLWESMPVLLHWLDNNRAGSQQNLQGLERDSSSPEER